MENQIEDIYELSPLQQGILFHTLFDPGTGVYTIQNTFPMEGELDLPLFERTWNKVIERHPILRTSFHWEGLDKPVQVVRRRAAMTIERYDWQHLAESEQEQQLEAFLQEDRRRGFDLTSPPLMRLTLIQTGDQRYQFVWSLHHLLLDGWSIALLRGEVFRIYMALCMGQPIDLPTPRPFGDYIAWLQQRDLGAAESFWRRTLQGLSAPTLLPAGNPHPEEVEPGQEYGEAFLTISAQTTAAIQSLVKQQRLTLNTLMQGVWALLLSRYSGERDVLFGATVSGRPTTLEGVESMIGLFINTLPVRVHVDPQRPLLDWLSDLQTHQVELRNYEYTPLVQIQSWSEIPRGQPLFESLFVFENYVQTPDVPQHERRLRVGPSRGLDPTNYPLSLMVIPMAEGHGPEATQQIYLRSVYDRRRFDAASIKRILGHAQAVVEAIAANPHQRVGDLSILTPAEYDQLIVAWNRTTVHYQPRLLHQLVEEQARRTPAAVAVVSEAGELTYAELDQRANQLAHYLCSLGVGPETFVGVCVDRSPAMVVAIVAILKAGGAYVPLDPTYPPERLAFMASDARIKVLLTQSHLQSRIAAPGLQVLALDSGWQAVAQQPADPLNVNVNGDTVAYSIYTSGSTGQPKGVLTSHAAIVNRLLWAQETYPLGEADRVLQQASFSFDFAVWEIFAPLITGARLILPAPDRHQDIGYLIRLIREQQVTVLHLVPSLLHVFVESAKPEDLESLRLVFSGGEALAGDTAARFFERSKATLYNQYGPTETTVDSTYWLCDPNSVEDMVPIGRPIANTRLYILDSQLRPVPIGVPGELYVAGTGLARGYLHRPALTAERFIPDPFSEKPGARMYRTGDLARYRPDGAVEYLGRVDQQVKIRGLRIELGEIETVLRQHEAVQEAAVIVSEDRTGDGYRDQRLVAYIVPANGALPPAWELRQFLRSRLPEWMVPATYIGMESIPRTPAGKLDRRALPESSGSRPDLAEPYVAPRTDTEATLARIWSEVLGVDRVGVYDNFFELGGHSLTAIRVMSRVREQFQHELPLRAVFEAATVAQFAALIEQSSQSGAEQSQQRITPVARESRRRTLSSLLQDAEK